MNPQRHQRAILIGCVVLFAGFVVWWWQIGQDRLVPKNFGTVEKGRIYRSGQIDAFIIEHTLETYGIDAIIDLAADTPGKPDPIAEREAAARLGIDKVDLWGLDGSGRGDIQIYIQALRELDARLKQNQTVLIHCSAGSQRAGALVAYYRLLCQGWKREPVWDEYMRYRWRRPQRLHLPDYVNTHMREVAEALVRAGLLDAVPQPLPVFGPPGYEPPAPSGGV